MRVPGVGLLSSYRGMSGSRRAPHSCRSPAMLFNKRRRQMANTTGRTTQPGAGIPLDDANRKLTLSNTDDPKLRHISVAGGTYTILVRGEESAGRYCLIDMYVPVGGGPPTHRHDF